MKKLIIFSTIIGFITFGLISCDTVENSGSVKTSGEWLVKESEIFDGGPGKDGIPALGIPDFLPVSSINYLSDDDLVLIMKDDNEVKIYPHPILDWHEIINDGIGDKKYALTYCPLTGSGISWNRIIDGEVTTFGVSGLLYNSNLIPYDRKTNSNWSQMRLQSINGELISTFIETFPVIETSWQTALQMFPEADVVSTNTGHSRNYGKYPYGSYRTNHSSFIFPVSNLDSRLNSKERVLGVLGNSSRKAYRISEFGNGKIILENLGTQKILVYGNTNNNIVTVFDLTSFSAQVELIISDKELPYVIKDSEGNHYDLFGKSMDSQKENLKLANFFVAYWFAWAAFYPETELHGN